MAEEVTLPQLGESVTEGVITAWLVEVGDTVEVDQPIVEISTDKVDTEIPSPVAGTVSELTAGVDDTIEVGQVIARIGEGEPAGDEDTDGDGEQPGESEAARASERATEDAATEAGAPEETEAAAEAGTDTSAQTTDRPTTSEPAQKQPSGDGQASAGSAALVSPLVRKLLREAELAPEQVRGTGQGGRITREDAERAIAEGAEAAPAAATVRPSTAAGGPPPPAPAAAGERERPEASPNQVDFGGERQVSQDLTRVRKAIAKGMMDSLQTTAQLTAAVEVDVTRVMNLRAAVKDTFRSTHGASLSPLPMIARAVVMTIPRHPAINASIDTEAGTATFHGYVNLGIAVDTERGLLVPNLKDAQDMTVPALAKGISDLAARTRDKKIQPDEISGATFTITNTGSRGTLFDTPILNPPQVAILATCAIEKRPVVISDAYGDSIAIRWMTYLCLTYDHRMIDGADTARFLQDVKYMIETHDFAPELGV